MPEATTQEGELFGTQRLNALIDSRFTTAGDLITSIVEQVQRHTGDAEQFDDITMLALRRAKL